MRGRKRVAHDNQKVMEILWPFVEDPLSTKDLPDWLDSCLSGSSRYGGSRPSSPRAILWALAQLPSITFEDTVTFVNRKWLAMEGHSLSRSYCYCFFKRLIMASKAIEYHYTRINPHSIKER